MQILRQPGNLKMWHSENFFNTSGFPIGMMMEKLVTVCGGPLMAQMVRKKPFQGKALIIMQLTTVSPVLSILPGPSTEGKCDPS